MEVDLTHLRLKGQTTNKILTIPFMQLPTFEFFVKKKKNFRIVISNTQITC